MELKFKRDTSFRKQFFVPESFAHPAKMDSALLLWIVERYTKPGEVILDPMAGSGTTMLACTLGRDVVLVELEEKFCKMMGANWELVKMRPQLGYSMGGCQIIQGDARQLEGLLIDKCIFSPPYAEESFYYSKSYLKYRLKIGRDPSKPSQQTEGYGDNPSNIGNLPYGQIDKIVTSPPHGDSLSAKRKGYTELENLADTRQYPENPNNLGNLPYGNIDSIITSPPYEEAQSGGGIAQKGYQGPKHSPPDLVGKRSYMPENIGDAEGNIGNLKSDSYLEAMLQVYQQCFKVLKPEGGLLILVTKNFIRNKQVVRLDEDTVKLCEQAGFKFIERHYRKLPAQSFWRIIYHQKHPEVEQIEHEDILVFQRSETER